MYVMYSCCLAAVFIFCGAQAHYSAESNVFHDVIHFLHGPFFESTNVILDANTLEHIYEELFEKAECAEKSANCSGCLNELLAVTGDTIDSLESWNQGSETVLYALLNLGSFCNLTLEEKGRLDGVSSFISLLSSGQIDEVGEEEIEALIELLEESFSGEEHHEEEEGHVETSTTENPLHSAENTTISGEEEHHSAKCFGEGTLLYYMGLDHEEAVNISRISELSGVILSFLVQDWVVSEVCPVIPKQTDFLDDIFGLLGDGNTISEEGFEGLLESLSIGSVEGAPTEAPGDGHGHKRSIRRRKRSASDEDSPTSQCLGEGTFSSIYGLDLEDGVTREQFIQLCPALIQQQISHSCEPVKSTSQPTEIEEPITVLQTYGYGTLAVIIISALALIGAVLIPCLHAQIVNYFLTMFVAMGVGTMLADALLHLMPQRHQHGHGHSHSLQVNPIGSTNKVKTGKEWSDSDMTSASTNSSQQELKEGKKKGIPAIALMILVGDGIHNFIDGIAIGAAFSTSLQDGLGTSIAVFCHELPHELGDFSILLQAGMSKTKAIAFNLLSASMCLIGLYIGAALGSNEEVRKWLLALTAGMFIYVALVDMLPELMTPQEVGKWWIYFIMQNIGMLTGISIMLIIAVFEEKIVHGL